MKYLLILLTVLLVFWALKIKRRAGGDEKLPGKPRLRGSMPAAATEMVACDVCKIHIPRSEAIVGPQGIYCSAAHRP